MEKGSYILLIELKTGKKLNIGALGKKNFSKGFYAYVGSAFGPGGLSRAGNHLEILQGEKDRKKWHIDYLNSLNSTKPLSVFITPAKVECDLAENMELLEIGNFGCSDCKCGSHLFYISEKSKIIQEVRSTFQSLNTEFKQFSPDKFLEKRKKKAEVF